MIYHQITKNFALRQNLFKFKILLWIAIISFGCITTADSQQDDSHLYLSDTEIVEKLVKKWAPLVWLAPSEKFMPGDVTEFLHHVHAQKSKTTNKYANENEINNYYYYDAENDELAALMQENRQWERRNKRNFKSRNFLLDYIIDLPIGENSENWFLVTNRDIDELLDKKSSFLYGKNPSNGNVPIYAMVNMCSSSSKQNQLQQNDIGSNLITGYEKIEYKKNPYIPLVSKQTKEPIYESYKTQSLQDEANNNNNNVIIETAPKADISVDRNNRHLVKRNTVETETLSKESKQEEKPLIETSPKEEDADWKPSINTVDLMNTQNIINSETNLNTNDNELNYQTPTVNQPERAIPHFHVTYWMFYPYSQGKQMCTLSLGPLGNLPIPLFFGICLGTRKDFGSHVGDWEHMSLYFRGKMEPEEMYVSAHDAGAYYSYERLTGTFDFVSQETRKGILQRPIFPRTVLTSSNHPVLFAAQGSHGLWTAPGKHRFVRVPRLYDINGFGTPWSTWKSVEINYEDNFITSRSSTPNWLQFRGRWGNPKTRCHPLRRIGLHFCEYSDGPTGIPMKPSHFTCNTNEIEEENHDEKK